ncbi:polysaccharide biosynthesis/export family protein [Saccharicrinis sp. 156]|uniref:polysaccharide biosynthesis/export family protein n=1 Tax=Saccharicrinis sp. 156 TaxID=3417574 RepID=UPI003D32EBB5
MNKYFFLALIVLMACLYTSCTTKKKLTYLTDLDNMEIKEGIPTLATEYKIKENDNLYIDIQTMNPEVNTLFNPSRGTGLGSGTQQNYGELSSQYLNGFQVDTNGDVYMPILGKVSVIGKTLKEVQEHIQIQADNYIKEASIKVKLLNFKITVMGEVQNPGVYYNYNSFITVLDAISLANGETEYSRIKEVLVVRQLDNGIKSYRLDLTKSEGFMSSEAFFLQPNDVVYIEPDRNKSLNINLPFFTLVMSSISTLILLLNYIN